MKKYFKELLESNTPIMESTDMSEIQNYRMKLDECLSNIKTNIAIPDEVIVNAIQQNRKPSDVAWSLTQ